jgi:hypothetical protein
MKLEAASSSMMSITIYHSTWCNTPRVLVSLVLQQQQAVGLSPCMQRFNAISVLPLTSPVLILISGTDETLVISVPSGS